MRSYITLLAVGLAVTLVIISTVRVSATALPTTPQPQNRTCSAEITSSKTGTCPPENPGLRCVWCNDNCRADTECPGQQKCCPQSGCGNGCKDTTDTTTTTSPKP